MMRGHAGLSLHETAASVLGTLRETGYHVRNFKERSMRLPVSLAISTTVSNLGEWVLVQQLRLYLGHLYHVLVHLGLSPGPALQSSFLITCTQGGSR